MLNVSTSPHVRCAASTATVMRDVMIALLPPLLFGVYVFGLRALLVILLSVAACVGSEYLYRRLMRLPSTVGDGSAVVTGLILAMGLPSSVPWWIPVMGGAFAIVIVKQLFGGIGQNIMNPALAARCFLLISFPALVGSGVFLFEETNSLTAEELTKVKALFAALGKVFVLPSALMGVGGAITGCGPAFVDLMIEAFADAGVYYGLPRDKALAMVSATIEGSAKLQKETGTHPGVLKDMVCSPGGSTIRGVVALEDAGFRAACISAIREIMK